MTWTNTDQPMAILLAIDRAYLSPSTPSRRRGRTGVPGAHGWQDVQVVQVPALLSDLRFQERLLDSMTARRGLPVAGQLAEGAPLHPLVRVVGV